MKNIFKNEKIHNLVIFLIIITCLISIFLIKKHNTTKKELIISIDGERYAFENGTYPSLSNEQIFTISSELGFNTIEIKNNSISVVDANCQDKTCIHMGKINFSNDTDMIICAPHKLCIFIK